MKQRFKMRVAVYLLLMKGDSVLLHLRCNTGYGDGLYGLVAGHVDGGEKVTDAMVREAQEEAGIVIDVSDLKISCVMHRIENGVEAIDYFMLANKWQNEIRNMEPNKCKELKFFDINSLPDNVVPAVRHGINCCLNGTVFSTFGWS
ncbi:NUDIX hydrolase [Candidatus Sneabacter namystus]|uniref:NUDIX domain-containing protein n=1 Tax=Candidatus Sneabacter namystus TaxID=2601646 RepID=A0A5C0UIN7_9RICK|nr:NUDIX domain-containing protein [Candidatus Sneabacter namystus]QEK39659.1 NUDIX domain-containing protein [Candidatus Sneabacter namystus]